MVLYATQRLWRHLVTSLWIISLVCLDTKIIHLGLGPSNLDWVSSNIHIRILSHLTLTLTHIKSWNQWLMLLWYSCDWWQWKVLVRRSFFNWFPVWDWAGICIQCVFNGCWGLFIASCWMRWSSILFIYDKAICIFDNL